MSNITIKGAREHNLKNIDIEIPKHQLTVFTGVSGSGKSSLVFSTIAQESQRLLNETYPAYIQGFMPPLDKPQVDEITGLTCSIVVNQVPLGANARSIVATASDAAAIIRTLFVKLAQPALPSTDAYSFNVASAEGAGTAIIKGKRVNKTFSVLGGMCPTCEGLGHVSKINEAAVIDDTKSLNEGAIIAPGYKPGSWNLRQYSECGLFDSDKKISDYPTQEREELLYGETRKLKINNINMTWEGLINKLRKSVFDKDPASLQPHMRTFFERANTQVSCPDCGGTRFADHTLESRIRAGHIEGNPYSDTAFNIAEAYALEARELALWVDAVLARADVQAYRSALVALKNLGESMVQMGIGYIALNRAASSLSGGEAQRLKLVKHLNSALSDATYIFDEPTAGLHPQDIDRMGKILRRLTDKGNTVLVVEHKRQMIDKQIASLI